MWNSLLVSLLLCWKIVALASTWPILGFQNGLDTKIEKSRKQMKERKNRAKKIRGVKKVQ